MLDSDKEKQEEAESIWKIFSWGIESEIEKLFDRVGLLILNGKEEELGSEISLLNRVVINSNRKRRFATMVTGRRGRCLLIELRKRGLEV